MKRMYYSALVFLIAINIPIIARSSDYDLESSRNYFLQYADECNEQSEVVIKNLKKYGKDKDRYIIFNDLGSSLGTSALRVLGLHDLYYLYDRLKSCATDKEKEFMLLQGQAFLYIYKKKALLEFNKFKLHYLQDKKLDNEYENWLKYINRLSNLCTFLEHSINYNFK